MKIIRETAVLELPETLEEGASKAVCAKPYRIDRVKEGDYITWFGNDTNWQFHNGFWTKLVDGAFVLCKMPEYEKIYRGLKNKEL